MPSAASSKARAPVARPQRPVAIVGGTRIPFCRSNTAYVDVGNFGLGLKAVAGLVERYNLHGLRLGELTFGAVIKHSADWNLAREIVLSSGLDAGTPGLTLQRACGTSLDAAIVIANKIATGQIDAGVAGGSDTTSDVPVVFGKRFSRRLLDVGRARSLRERLRAFRGFRPGELKPQFPGVGEPRTGMSMGQHTERMAREWGITRQEQDELALASHLKAAAAYERGFFSDLVVPFRGVQRDNNLRADSTLEKLATLKPAFDRSSGHGTLTAGNSTPLTDGASAVLLADADWAEDRGLPVRAWLRDARVAAVDFVHGQGLLMAPTIAVAELLKANGLALQDFDIYEIHEAFAAQVLCTLRAWESPEYCRDVLGLDAPLGAIDPAKLNPVGSSLAVGHPFAATGARLIATAAKQLEERGGGRALLSVCTAGGMGVAAIIER
ncbi:acetyl-CoA C-acetyltransferase [Pseudofulvimonas gallinarii]|jgi:acetyl-CoA C-acetyltransferase|uniref:3-ketoacyl-CoA thiolase n=1 Tax=Pseudofulvimonas gallinarii TaxID=634155 RepID=A0A4R3LGL5_9GAMM|nr:acetyl-CoA C-acetyltransferase [Pseudofulvimonas gallinarii]TCS99229.1 3-ketoacyl-CoA thiolase [Pseudofulvimonas gallinarii]THD13967.1 acetyl-CoA acetyltransferase [Pseudofulvimonas gallinarii]